VKRRTALILWLVAIAAAVRLVFLYGTNPWTSPDSIQYMAVARQIANHDFSDYTGARSPGFPFLLLVCGQSPRVIRFVQCGLGILTCLVLFKLGFRLTADDGMAFWVGLSHAVALNQILLEGYLMPEAISTLLVVLSVYMVVRLMDAANGGVFMYVCLGVAAAYAGLIRPNLAVLPLVYLPFLVIGWNRPTWFPPKRILGTAVFLLVWIAPMVGWSIFNKWTVGHFGLTTMVGYSLIQHTGGFIEKAPDEYSTVKRIFLPTREKEIQRTGHHSRTIFGLEKTLMRETKLSTVDLDRLLTRMSLTLIAEYPLLYLSSVFDAWVNFWRVSKFGIQAWSSETAGRQFMLFVFWVEVVCLVVINGLFLLLPTIFLIRLRRGDECSSPSQLLIITTVLSASILQAATVYGDSPRYALPFQPLICAAVFACLYRLGHWWRTRNP